MEVITGRLYHIKDEYFDRVNDKGLLINHENGHSRPSYLAIKDNNILWFIPLSTQVDKSKKIIDNKIKKYGKWEELEEYCPTNNCAWNAIAYGPDKYGHLMLDLDWSYLYGELKPGRYRIAKDALRNDEECSEKKCDKYYFSVVFDID